MWPSLGRAVGAVAGSGKGRDLPSLTPLSTGRGCLEPGLLFHSKPCVPSHPGSGPASFADWQPPLRDPVPVQWCCYCSGCGWRPVLRAQPGQSLWGVLVLRGLPSWLRTVSSARSPDTGFAKVSLCGNTHSRRSEGTAGSQCPLGLLLPSQVLRPARPWPCPHQSPEMSA